MICLDKKDRKDVTQTVVLSTANPYKFPQDVLYALSGNDVKDSFKGIKRLNLLTAMRTAPTTANYNKGAYNTGSVIGTGNHGFDAKQ